MVGALYTRIHLAGPGLTVAKMKPGALPVPEAGGYYSKSVLTPSTGPTGKDGIAVRDAALAWFDPTKNATDQATMSVGDGAWMYLDGGTRYIAGTWPKNKKGFFDKTLTTTHRGVRRPAGVRAEDSDVSVHGLPELRKRHARAVTALGRNQISPRGQPATSVLG